MGETWTKYRVASSVKPKQGDQNKGFGGSGKWVKGGQNIGLQAVFNWVKVDEILFGKQFMLVQGGQKLVCRQW